MGVEVPFGVAYLVVAAWVALVLFFGHLHKSYEGGIGYFLLAVGISVSAGILWPVVITQALWRAVE